MAAKITQKLRRGWTTGACATAATKAAFFGLNDQPVPDPVEILLPGGQKPTFALALQEKTKEGFRVGIIKDAGDDPDVTHGALIICHLRRACQTAGIRFSAGNGVGTVTRPGLPLAVGEPAINPAPRQMIILNLTLAAAQLQADLDVNVEISIPNGQKIAERTLNSRLGILGGLSILGTSGIVIPYSCSAWIASIHRAIDVARAAGVHHIAASTGATSEKAIKEFYQLPEIALIEMGDFVGGMLKYLKTHPVARLTIAGGLAKMTKLAGGLMDLHAAKSPVDPNFLASIARKISLPPDRCHEIIYANSVLHAFEIAAEFSTILASEIASLAQINAAKILNNDAIIVETVVIDRQGLILARAGSQ